MRKFHPWVLSLCGIFAALLIAELVARVVLPSNRINRYVYDPVLGHARPRGESGTYQTSEFTTTLSFNSLGFRDKEWNPMKPPGTFRIALLGDSYVEGAQVSEQEVFARVLENLLSEPLGAPARIEVMNLGVSGYGTTQEMELLRTKVLRFEPDLVVLTFLSGNDIRNNSLVLDQGTSDWKLAARPYFDLKSGDLSARPLQAQKPWWLDPTGNIEFSTRPDCCLFSILESPKRKFLLHSFTA